MYVLPEALPIACTGGCQMVHRMAPAARTPTRATKPKLACSTLAPPGSAATSKPSFADSDDSQRLLLLGLI